MTPPTDGGAAAPSRVRAGVAPPPVATTRPPGRVPPAERARLRASLGVLLTAELASAGWTVRRLARAVGCDRRTVQRLQAGSLRPREVTLRAIASALDPDTPGPLAGRLLAAAGPSLRPDTPGAIRRRVRAGQAAILAGHRPLPSDVAERIRLHRAASAARARAYRLLAQPGALDTPEILAAADRLLTEARRLHEQAGPAVVIRLGRHEIRAGWGA